ncbi:hypothetical protein [Oxynema aestuarii]|uniref:Uncharacterized protein n=1 Tax=Oxynema aestuarii AP17 TaxID=2064643 RepID=A0A6H1U0C5_9CYAN|nr:hypothetical protein [Oxynema aestuarii]QIZ72318.1 hypothetical protein HCG48_18490 [Oxynema aestuarii AP17]
MEETQDYRKQSSIRGSDNRAQVHSETGECGDRLAVGKRGRIGQKLGQVKLAPSTTARTTRKGFNSERGSGNL